VFSFLDLSLLDDTSVGDNKAPINDLLLQDIARAYFESIHLSIERNTPPNITQSQIAALDEDTSSAYSYGPSIHGGKLHLTVDHAVATLIPLNLSIPLVRISSFDMNGYLFLTGLSSETKRAGQSRTSNDLLMCHHCLSFKYNQGHQSECGCCYGIVSHSSGIPVKVYSDSKVECCEFDVNYGSVLNSSIPQLMQCIQRLLPPSPPNPNGKQRAQFLSLDQSFLIIPLFNLKPKSIL
jgi:hypothetical protein